MISTSILKLQNDSEKIKVINKSETDMIHFDVMDGIFVSNKTRYDKLPFLTKPVDIHLMVEDVRTYVDKFMYLKPNSITFHLEIHDDINNIISYIKEKNIKVGIAIKPETKVEELLPYLDQIDLVLVMTVSPGAGGQPFMKEMIPKVKELRKLQQKHHFQIEVDGGINDKTIKLCDADIYVVGSYITNSDYPNEIIKYLKSI